MYISEVSSSHWFAGYKSFGSYRYPASLRRGVTGWYYRGL